MSKPQDPQSWYDEFYRNLHSITDTAFPKKCTKCGKVYPDGKTFLLETTPVKDITLEDRSGLFMLDAESIESPVGVFRNCACGSTLMADFENRRDTSEAGVQRREQFDKLMAMLVDQGLPSDEARSELRRLIRGKPSPKVQKLLGKIKLA